MGEHDQVAAEATYPKRSDALRRKRSCDEVGRGGGGKAGGDKDESGGGEGGGGEGLGGRGGGGGGEGLDGGGEGLGGGGEGSGGESLAFGTDRYVETTELFALLSDVALGGLPVRLLRARWLLEHFQLEVGAILGHRQLLEREDPGPARVAGTRR